MNSVVISLSGICENTRRGANTVRKSDMDLSVRQLWHILIAQRHTYIIDPAQTPPPCNAAILQRTNSTSQALSPPPHSRKQWK